MTDSQIILSILEDYKFHHILEIIQRGKPGAANWAVRSRISDLRKKGYDIEMRIASDGQAEYRLKEQVKYNYDNMGQGCLL